MPPTNEEVKKALEKRRREMLPELRRRRRAEEVEAEAAVGQGAAGSRATAR